MYTCSAISDFYLKISNICCQNQMVGLFKEPLSPGMEKILPLVKKTCFHRKSAQYMSVLVDTSLLVTCLVVRLRVQCYWLYRMTWQRVVILYCCFMDQLVSYRHCFNSTFCCVYILHCVEVFRIVCAHKIYGGSRLLKTVNMVLEFYNLNHMLWRECSQF